MRVLLLTAACGAWALPANLWTHIRDAARETPDLTATKALHFCGQSQDHFDDANAVTWCQRYFVDTQYWAGPGSPVFLCVGGEGPAFQDDVLSTSVHCSDMTTLAPKVGAMMFAVEHRYYGSSFPSVSDLSTESLRFLSSRQALADLAKFNEFATASYNLSSDAKWITFGGSYPGMLAGWARLKYPTHFHGAISSSAPVRAQVNYQGYLDVTAQSLAQRRVGGSIRCAGIIEQGHADIKQMLASSVGRRSLESMFNICGDAMLDDVDNQALWAGFGVVYIDVQENDPSCTDELCNIGKVCDFVTTEAEQKTPLEVMASFSRKSYGDQCVNVDFGEYENGYFVNTTLTGGTGRVWFYQTCNEFAFYQTCDEDSNCPFTKGLNTLEWNLKQCEAAFNISADQVSQNVVDSNNYYGADRPTSTRVVFPNGQVDPWHYLSVLVTPGPDLPTVWVPGASHHFWTHLPQDSDDVLIDWAREAIWKHVTEFLETDDDAHGADVVSVLV